MFRSKNMCRLMSSQLITIRMNASTAKSCSTIPRDVPRNEGSLIPEHLRFKNKDSFSEKWNKILTGDTAPMVPMTILLVGAHLFVLWYLFGGQFEDDFGEDLKEEEIREFAGFILKTKRIFTNVMSSLGLRSEKSMKQKSNEKKDLISS